MNRFAQMESTVEQLHAMINNLLETFESWTEAMNEGYGIDIIYLDYRKSFDTVPHQRLIYKLAKLGVSGKVLDWLKNFLTCRTMRLLLTLHIQYTAIGFKVRLSHLIHFSCVHI